MAEFHVDHRQFLHFCVFIKGIQSPLPQQDEPDPFNDAQSGKDFLLPVVFIFEPAIIRQNIQQFAGIPGLLQGLCDLLLSCRGGEFFLQCD